MEQVGAVQDGEAEERQPFDTNADILPAKKVKAPAAPAQPEKDEKMSKRKKRKLEQLAQKRQSQELRAEVLKELKTVQLSSDQAALLRASQSTNVSRREQVALAKQRVALGVPLTADMRKLRRKRPKAAPEEEEASDDAAETSGRATASAAAAKPPQSAKPDRRLSAAPLAAAVPGKEPVAQASSSSSTSKAAAKPGPSGAASSDKPSAQAESAAASSGNADAGRGAQHAKANASAKAKAKASASSAAAPAAVQSVVPPAAPSPQPLQRVRVQRREDIDAQREKLPAVMMEQELVEMALGNDVMLVCGETGCGKSTQVPQFLYEAGFCDGDRHQIAVTQPRRVAAISVSQRVGEELNDASIVGYQVRYDKSNCSRKTKIKFMTDGILLREVQADFLCKKYSVIIIDEAHERGVNCDILIGLLSRAVAQRRKNFEAAVAAGLYKKAPEGKEGEGAGSSSLPPPPLKLVIMSATLRLCDFTENTQLFPTPPPVARIEARTFPVTVHFSRFTEDDYVKAAHRAVLKIHRDLPPGTILVFVTGRQEVHRLCKMLNSSRAARRGTKADDEADAEEQEEEEDDDEEEANGFQQLEASDDEENNFDDDLADAAQSAESNGGQASRKRKGKRKQVGDMQEQKAAVEEVAAPQSPDAKAGSGLPAPKCKKRKGKLAKKKANAADPEQQESKQGDDVNEASQADPPQGNAAEKEEGSVQGSQTDGTRKKKKRRKAVLGESGTADPTAEEGAVGGKKLGSTGKEEVDEGELEVDFRLDHEEDVVVLDPEASSAAAEDAKDAEAKAQKRIKMTKLDKSRTAGGAFKGIGFGEGPLRALPLYAQLPSSMQLAPFGARPEGERTIVVSTNVAETSVTLPNVRYVIDTGHEKRRKYRASSGISAFAVERISKASADQRAGRAGRLGPGHSYRLYSAAAYENHFQQFAPIPMLHTPMDPVLLLLSFLGVPRLDVFPWPTPPSMESVAAAVRRLRALGAIAGDAGGGGAAAAAASAAADVAAGKAVRCTQLGFRLAALPVAPRYGKMLLTAITASEDMDEPIISHACAIVAALSVGNLTCWEPVNEDPDVGMSKVREGDHELVRAQKEAQRRLLEAQRQEAPRWSTLRDDAEGLLWLMGGYAWAARGGDAAAEKFCKANRVNFRNIGEAHSLMQQLAELLQRRLSLEAIGTKLELPLQLKPPTPAQSLKLRECIIDGLIDRVAVNCPDLGPHAYLCADLGKETPVFIHSASNAHRHRPRPTVLVFNEIISTNRPCMRDCIAVDPTLLARRASAGDCPLLQLGDFLPVPAPRYLQEQDHVLAFCSPSYAPLAFTLPTIEISVPADMIFRYKVFAKALLEGQVVPGMPPAGARLLAQPSIVLHAPTNPRVAGIIGPLWASRVGSRAELVRKWTENSRFLLEGYLKWLPASLHDDVCVSWPPLDAARGKRRGGGRLAAL